MGQFMNKYIFIIICLFSLLIYQCKTEINAKESESNATLIISDTVRYYTNKLNTQTASINTLQVKKHELSSIILKKDKELANLASTFNKINHITKYKNITVIDTIRINFKDSIPHLFNLEGKVERNWYNFKYTSTNKGIQIDSFSIPTETTIITGIKRKWFLGPRLLTTEITNSNPFIKITEITSADIFIPEPWYKKWYVWLSTGIISGWFLAN